MLEIIGAGIVQALLSSPGIMNKPLFYNIMQTVADMCDSRMSLLLLPGMDGTGRLFGPFLDLLPGWVAPGRISYPTDVPLAYPDLEEIIERVLPSEGNFAILAESYSGPIAVRIAAKNPRGLRALILVGTFVTTPRRLTLAWQPP